MLCSTIKNAVDVEVTLCLSRLSLLIFLLKIMVKIMSEFFESIKQGLTEAIQYSEEKCPKAVVHKFSSIDVKNIRSKSLLQNQ